jgi:hypothetical protein
MLLAEICGLRGDTGTAVGTLYPYRGAASEGWKCERETESVKRYLKRSPLPSQLCGGGVDISNKARNKKRYLCTTKRLVCLLR